MKEITKFLKELISIAGLSGFEDAISERISEEWEPLVDTLYQTKLNSLHGLKKGTNNSKGYSVMIAAHMDEIGFIVTSTRNGFLKIASIGGLDARSFLGQAVNVHTESGIFDGIIVLPAAHTLSPKEGNKSFTLEDLVVDIGYPPKQVIEKVKIGNLVSLSNPPIELDGNHLVGHSLDNRASVAALTKILKELQNHTHQWDVIASATVQEEIGLKGAVTSAFHEKPTIAIILDVDFAKSPGNQSYETHDLDKGPALSWGPTNHPQFYKEIEKLAKKLEIPIQKAIIPGTGGTDGDVIQTSIHGIPSILLGIPIRYMHTSSEMVQIRDIERLARLISTFIKQLDDNFITKLKWEAELEDINGN